MSTDIEWIDSAEVAKIIRQQLKTRFAGTQFSVRTSRYAGGSSIRVRWTDGPTEFQVEDVARRYAGGRFDGSIDLAYSVVSWLLPDGTATVAHDPGTAGSRGANPEHLVSPRHPDARLVRFGANYVFTNRDYSPEFLARRVPTDCALFADPEPCRFCMKRADPTLAARVPGVDGRPSRIEPACSDECAAALAAPYVAERVYT